YLQCHPEDAAPSPRRQLVIAFSAEPLAHLLRGQTGHARRWDLAGEHRLDLSISMYRRTDSRALTLWFGRTQAPPLLAEKRCSGRLRQQLSRATFAHTSHSSYTENTTRVTRMSTTTSTPRFAGSFSDERTLVLQLLEASRRAPSTACGAPPLYPPAALPSH